MPRHHRKVCGVHKYRIVWSDKLQKPVKRVKEFNFCGPKGKRISREQGRKIILKMLRKKR